jgi:hypothetical protein
MALSGHRPVSADATAYPHHDANFVMNVHTRWREPGDEQAAWRANTLRRPRHTPQAASM